MCRFYFVARGLNILKFEFYVVLVSFFFFQWYSLLIIESNNATRSFLVHTEDRKKIRATKQHKFAARPIKVNIAAQSYCCHVLLVTSSNIRRTKKPHPHTHTHTLTLRCTDVHSCSAHNFEFRMHETKGKKSKRR